MRTSSTVFDQRSPVSLKLQRRAFDLLGVEWNRGHADGLQVLRYFKDQWYKPHTDWFDKKSLENNEPHINNGTNRFATVFLYLADCEEGGYTTFPLSTSHEGWRGDYTVGKASWRNPGYISMPDARWACNDTSGALKVPPKKGHAVLFYNQKPDGRLEGASLHGGCPVTGEDTVKWAANLWVWNRPWGDRMNSASARKSGARKKNKQPKVQFLNTRSEDLELFWVEVGSGTHNKVADIAAGKSTNMNSYTGHQFVVKRAGAGPKGAVLQHYTVNKDDRQNVEVV